MAVPAAKVNALVAAIVAAPLIVLAPEEVRNVPVEPERSKLPLADVAPLMIGAVRVLLVRACEVVRYAGVTLVPARSGIVIVAAPTVWAAVVIVTVCAVASAAVSFNPPLVFPRTVTKPVLVLPVAVVTLGVVASATDTAPLKVLAPLEVLNVPVEAEKSFEPEPEAVRPPAMIGVVRVSLVITNVEGSTSAI